MNKTLLAYSIEVLDQTRPFEFYVPKLTPDSLVAVEVVDDDLKLWILADAKLPTQKYIGRFYAVNEPYERPKISTEMVIRKTWTMPLQEPTAAMAAAGITYAGPRIPQRTDRMVFIFEPTAEEVKAEVRKYLREATGPGGRVLPEEVMDAIVSKIIASMKPAD